MGMGKIVDLNQFILQLEKAVANGVATLDSSVKVPKSQISLTASDVGAIATNDSNTILTTLNAASGTISSSILPSYVDDFLVFANLAAFPASGESGKIYLAENTNLSYRWTGTSYVDISSAGISDAALKLNTPRTIASTGDGSWSVSFDGSTNISAALTLATVNSNTGSFGNSTQIPTLTIDAKGRITSASNSSIGNELIALQALPDTVGFLRKTGDGAYSIDTNSYLVNTTTFSVDGTNNRVGIGTTTPEDRFHVAGGSARIDGNLVLRPINGTTATSTIEVGFGRTGSGISHIDFIGDTTYTDCGLRLLRSAGPNGGSYLLSRGTGSLALITQEAAPIEIRTTDTTRMVITATGNVGIGTAAPAERLHIVGIVRTENNFGDGNTGMSFQARAAGTAQGQLAGYSFLPTFMGTADNGPRRAADIWAGFNGGSWGTQHLSFGVGSASNDLLTNVTTERMRIDASGNVGIGIVPAAWSPPALQIGNAGLTSRNTTHLMQLSANQYFDGTHKYISTGAAAAIYTQNNGVHTWASAPAGTADAPITFTTLMNIDASGSVSMSSLAGTGNRLIYSTATGGLTNSSSDGRMKTHIQSLNNCLQIVNQLNPIRFNWKKDFKWTNLKTGVVEVRDLQETLGAQNEIGLIAQEVNDLVPEVIGINEEGTYSLDYSKLVPVLIQAIKELKLEVDNLKTQLFTT